ncbi:MAG: methyltransferase domain-containing protein [Nitrososphaerota archaeon]|nr:methyltransferase domain-containing protein [Nitrososphaerota archaeon]MDG7052131.1 methyltransferase domain-containing protein [Nitrososphaerota archaeon]
MGIEDSKFYMRIIPPYGIRIIKKQLKKNSRGPLRILDIGCGNHSPLKFHIHFTKRQMWYTCIDKEKYNIDSRDKIDKLFLIDLELTNILELINEKFDVIYFSHVIEHLNNGFEVLEQLRMLQNSGGILYVETPSIKSLNLPKRKNSTLNFYDDPTHKRVYPLHEIISLLERNNYRIIKYGYRRDYRRIMIAPLGIFISIVRDGEINGSLLWDLTGFANYVLAMAL